ncbi:GD23782 [Drosophila simulans]|uniref:GD23782 n=1 Tax=Drosophila simulans TaxID=7240 RepID=B4Q380_DROSI|nr:GD23782 [Drosophila simulans]
MDSGDEILGKYQKQRAFSRREIWLKAVNGYRNMADSNVIYRIAMIPSYCVLANFIPVISNDRALIGWNKYTSCLGLLILPIICLPHGFKAVSWLIVCLTCWTLSILTFISTHSLRRPDNIWIFALLGLIVSSVFINLLSREIENIIYQYISMQFDVMPDVTALIYFGLGEMLSESIVVRCLQQRKMWDATFGVVMSLVTYAIFLAFPLLFYQGCYNNKCSQPKDNNNSSQNITTGTDINTVQLRPNVLVSRAAVEIYLSYMDMAVIRRDSGSDDNDDDDVEQLKPRRMMTRRTVHGSAESPAANVQ